MNFIAFDETLISSLKLTMMESKDPWAKQGQVRWYKPVKPGALYLLALDPSLGTGGDKCSYTSIRTSWNATSGRVDA